VFNILRDKFELKKKVRFLETELAVVLGKVFERDREIRKLRKVIESYKKQGWRLHIDD
tara:strand:- start:392 stop:565 length:174 start_codon:yes stop_codon:yes gene_type:complete